MIQFFLVNTSISLAALAMLPLFRGAPQRIKLYICLTPLILWLFPIHYWSILTPLSAPELPLYLLPLLGSSVDTVSMMNQSAGWFDDHLLWLFVQIAAGLGIVRFIFEAIRYQLFMHSLQTRSVDGAHLRQHLPQHLQQPQTPIGIVDGFSGAITTGIIKPQVWIGRSHLTDGSLQGLLVHEMIHVKRHDNRFLWFVTLMSRLMWWNPSVWLLTSRCRLYLETSCDEASAKHFEPGGYQRILAQLLLSRSRLRPLSALFANGVFHVKNTNLRRVKLLERSFRMKPKHYALLILLLSFAGSLIAFQPPPTTSVRHQDASNPEKQSKYKGFSIETIDVQDADIVDLLRYIADQAGFNLFVHDSVQDIKVTYKFENIPWDQALDIILTNAQLEYHFSSGALRVGAPDVIREELEHKLNMQELREANEPLEILTITLANADATDVSQMLGSFLSSRGNVKSDARTNIILVQDIPSRLKELKAVITKLDRPVQKER